MPEEIRNRLKVMAPGSAIRFVGLSVKVLQVCIEPGGAVRYFVGWFDNGEYTEKWLYDFQLKDDCNTTTQSVIITMEDRHA